MSNISESKFEDFLQWCRRSTTTREGLGVQFYGKIVEDGVMYPVIRKTFLTIFDRYSEVWGPKRHPDRRWYWSVMENSTDKIAVLGMFLSLMEGVSLNIVGSEEYPNISLNWMRELGKSRAGLRDSYSRIEETSRLLSAPGPQAIAPQLLYCPHCRMRVLVQGLIGGVEDTQSLGDLPGPVSGIPERLAGDEPVASVFEHPVDVGPPAIKLDMSDYSTRLWRALRREGCTTNLELLGLDMREFSSRKNVGAVTVEEAVAAQEYLRSSIEQQ